MSEACQQCPKLEGACIMHLEIDLAYIQNEIPPWVLIFACVLPLTPNVR